ncbi:cell division protein FtsB [Shewanella sp. NIFS-20-20]|uniref:cell division protein FtsB n=1 Tax=Shewanella sp. NIFS-20-20 TaxID=2853806 RepID=UPI001C473C9E|nr:cell division protein FtsB [Shewanella sp. NIFS-20-20]MBV7316726.1 cell division protein FtsB [Shewanella sp. NIFS-20-20]
MKRFVLLMVILLAVLQYRLWFGENSVPEYFQLEQQIANQQQSNTKLVERNDILREEISDLRRGTGAIEERARNELGMVKQGETFYRVVGSTSSQ